MIFPKHNARLNFTGYHPLCPPKATPRKSRALRAQGWAVVWSGLVLGKEAGKLSKLKEQYPVTAHAPNFDFWTGCCEIKRCEESKRTLKNPFASRLAEFNTTLKLLRITDQWYIVPESFDLGKIGIFWRYFYCRWPREDQKMGSTLMPIEGLFLLLASIQAHYR